MSDESQKAVCTAIGTIAEARRQIEERLGKEIQSVMDGLGRTPFRVDVSVSAEEVSILDDSVRTFVHTVSVRASVPRGW